MQYGARCELYTGKFHTEPPAPAETSLAELGTRIARRASGVHAATDDAAIATMWFATAAGHSRASATHPTVQL